MTEEKQPDGELVGNLDLFKFFGQFGWWQITQETAGRMLVMVRTENRAYVKLYSRKNESLNQLVDRLRSKVNEHNTTHHPAAG